MITDNSAWLDGMRKRAKAKRGQWRFFGEMPPATVLAGRWWREWDYANPDGDCDWPDDLRRAGAFAVFYAATDALTEQERQYEIQAAADLLGVFQEGAENGVDGAAELVLEQFEVLEALDNE